ncbi:hypothetical protein SUGI_0483020 [Cryptomeria japonica]|nr:hypothetical protein SUGI_0483020 [Cryptomeria japonica]
MQMNWVVVVRLVIYLCLVGFTAAAKCVPEKCGSLNVSYPFYIKDNNSDCGHRGFQINCTKDNSTGKMALFLPADVSYNNSLELTRDYYKIWQLNYSGYIVINSTSLKAVSCGKSEAADKSKQFELPGPFYFSMSDKFVVVGCNRTGSYENRVGRGEAKCVSSCVSRRVGPEYCRYGFCEITLPDNLWSIKFHAEDDFSNDEFCGFSTIMDPSTFNVVKNKTDISWEDIKKAYYGLRLNWGIGRRNCTTAKGTAYYACSSNAECTDSRSGGGHACTCLPGYVGNGYKNGTKCIDIDDCSDRSSNECVEPSKGGKCNNLPGSYNCSCAEGYTGDGFKNGSSCESESSNRTAMFAAIGSVSAFVGVSLAGCALVLLLRMRYLKRARDEYFLRNGGFLLERILAEKGKQTEEKIFRIFSENELKSASGDYSDDMKLGTGGSSTVYKGILSNGTPVAIKKFKEFPIGVESEEAMNQFINEIVILSGLNHKNVVKLVGCCLQTQSPILVYEFVDGGTISHQLHSGHLTWQSRLQIAMGSAEAFAYLHSELDRPIIHRDVKSTNILLDNTVTPKVADFGISRLLCGNDTHLSTNIMGTCGYMDPEYYETGTLTEKSDVYSFGVLLAELLTGRQPLSPGRPPHEIILSKFFLSKCKDDCLIDILDPNVKNEENLDQMTAVASLARECLCAEGKGRPTMRKVKLKLEEIGGSTRLATSTSCLNVVSDQISSETHIESRTTVFQFTEMSTMQGR